MRGKDECDADSFADGGITPAYAGKSCRQKAQPVPPWDHPRLCGEKAVATKKKPVVVGITPAYAGKRIFDIDFRTNAKDHPRLCGEKHHRPTLLVERIGSPPPMRGKVAVGRLKIISIGITPAYAGKRYVLVWRRCKSQDHPRLCGEKW